MGLAYRKSGTRFTMAPTPNYFIHSFLGASSCRLLILHRLAAFCHSIMVACKRSRDQLTLARAFVLLLQMNPQIAHHLRLVMVGDGPLRGQVADILEQGGARSLAWLAGERDDIPQIMRGLDLFVLPSLAEGVSNTILEAMASGLPVWRLRSAATPNWWTTGAREDWCHRPTRMQWRQRSASTS